MPVKPTSQQVGPEQLHQMAQQDGLHLSDADIAFFHSFLPYSADQLALDALQSHSNVTVTNTDEQIAFLPHNSAYPALQTWVLGGHSLGGAVAADFLATHPNVRGLLLYAASSSRDLSKRTDLAVTLIYGTHDAVVAPANLTSIRSNFPAQTQYVAIEGGIHSFFGDYIWAARGRWAGNHLT